MNDTYIYSTTFMIKAKELEISKICPEELTTLNIILEYVTFKIDKNLKWQRGKSFNDTKPFNDIELRKCENPWKNNDKIPIDVKNITSILNKLTEENYDNLLKETIAFNYSNPVIVKKIFRKVLGEPLFAGIYSKFCKDLVGLHSILKELYITEFNENRHKNLAVFIGELYKIGLIDDLEVFIDTLVNDLTESNLEILCKLIATIGKTDIHFKDTLIHINSIKNSFSSRYKFMILDILEDKFKKI